MRRPCRVLVLAVSASAAAARRSRRRRPPARRARRPSDVEAYIVSNLQESLGLSDEQFAKVLPLVKQLQTDRRELAQRRMQSLRELRRLLESGGATEAQVDRRS